MTCNFFDCKENQFSINTFFYDDHVCYIKTKNKTYKHFYRID